MRRQKTAPVRLLPLLVLVLTAARSGHAADQATHVYDIAPQSVSSALKAFAAQSGMQLIYTEADVGQFSTEGVSGDLSPEAALAVILKGTGLRFEFTVNHVVVVQKNPPRPVGNSTTDQHSEIVLEEVVVTAQKVAQKLQDVPDSITAVTGQQLMDLHATQISDWASYVPGLNFAGGGTPGMGTFILEGIAPIGSASEVGTYVNDAPIGSSSSFGIGSTYTLDLMPYDLERIEVLRGPQGTLYGASAMGGLVKYVLKAPDSAQFTATAGVEGSGTTGAAGHGAAVRGALNIPLLADHLAARLSAYDVYTPGYIDNGLTRARDQNGVRQSGWHAALRWELSSELSVQASGLYQRVAASNQGIVALDQSTGRPLYGDLTNDNLRPEPFKQHLHLYDVTLNWNLPWGQLVGVSSYQEFQNLGVGDISGLVAPLGPSLGVPGLTADFSNSAGVEKFTQEVRLASHPGGPFKWLVGGFFTHEISNKDQVFNLYDSSGVPIAALNPFEIAGLPSTYREYAAFGDLTYSLNSRWEMTGGLRVAHNSQRFVEQVNLGPLGGGRQPDLSGQSAESVTTFMVTPTWHLSDKSMLYVRVASGYQPGGPNVSFPGFPAPPQFNSSKLIDYQPGFKATFLNDRASVDLAAFYIDWTRIQLSIANPDTGGGTSIVNGGKARSQGMDLSGSYSPLTGLVLGAGLNYTDAILTTPVASLQTRSGARLPYIPRWSGSFTAQYSAILAAKWRIFAGGGFRYSASRLSVPEGEGSASGLPAGYSVSSYGVTDLRGGFAYDGLTVALYAKNISDKRAYLAPAIYRNSLLGAPIDIQAPVLQPRTLGISIDKTF